MTSTSEVVLTAPVSSILPVPVVERLASFSWCSHLLLLHIQPVVTVQHDGFGCQRPLNRICLVEHDESKVGHKAGSLSTISATSTTLISTSCLLVDPNIHHLAVLGEELHQLLLCTVVRQVSHKKLLAVTVSSTLFLLAEPLRPGLLPPRRSTDSSAL